MIGELGENLVFLLGLPRSGTTLLSVLLNKHPHVYCPSEPWLMLALEAIGRTPDTDPSDAAVLYHAMEEFLSDEMHVESARVYARHAYNSKLAETGRTIFIDKTPRYYLILPFIHRVFPKAKYLLLLRNPLDVAASMKQTWRFDLHHEFQHKQDALGSVDLNYGLRQMMAFSCNPDHPAYFVRYEELVKQPREKMIPVFTHIGVDPALTPAETDFDIAETSFAKSVVGDRKIIETHSPHAKSIDSWKRVFSAEEARTIIDGIGPGMLRDLQYGASLQDAAEMGVEIRDESIALDHFKRQHEAVMRRVHKYTACVTFAELLASRETLSAELGVELPLDPMARVKLLLQRVRDLKAAAANAPGAHAAEFDRALHAAKLEHAEQIADLRRQLEAERERSRQLADTLRTAAAEVEAAQHDYRALHDNIAAAYQHAREWMDRARRLASQMAVLFQLWPLRGAWKLRLLKTLPWAWNWHEGDPPAVPPSAAQPTPPGRLQDIADALRGLIGPHQDLMAFALAHLRAKGFRPRVVLDIGAAKGYWSEAAQYQFFPDADFYMIDPLRQSEEHLAELTRRNAKFHYLLMAMGSRPGTTQITVGDEPDGSSLLPFEDGRPHPTQEVTVETIDRLIEHGQVQSPDLVKIDVQGFELEVLKGGHRMFHTAQVFIIEVNLYEFMPNTPLVDRVISYMAEHGYRVYDVAGDLRRPYQNDLAQLDLVFVKNGSALVASNQWK